jgi:hypothetical protein
MKPPAVLRWCNCHASVLVLRYMTLLCTTIWGSVVYTTIWGCVHCTVRPDSPRIAQKCTATATLYKLYTLYNRCDVDSCGENGTHLTSHHGDSWIILVWATGTWAPFTRLFQDSSFHLIQNLIHFFFFPGWNPCNLVSGVNTGNTFSQIWDRFYHLMRWFHICRH